MTALIYKAALPTYTSAEALAANADENLVLNDAGTAYELEPAQGGAYVAGSDQMVVESDYNAEQTIVAGAAVVLSTLTMDTPSIDIGDSFEVGTKGIKVLEGTLFAGRALVDVTNTLAAQCNLTLQFYESLTNGGAKVGSPLTYMVATLPAGTAAPFLTLPFWLSGVTPGRWVCLVARCSGANLVVDSFGGMDIRRIA